VAINAIQMLCTDKRLPGLRYQWRDRPHTVRTCALTVHKIMRGERKIHLLELLITGQHSFCKRAKHSRRVQHIWKVVQREDMTDFLAVLEHLSYAEHRYDSRSEPMSIICSKVGAIVAVLVLLASDLTPAHKLDRDWSTTLLEAMKGEEGLEALINFGVDSDHALATHVLTRAQDKSQADLSLTAEQVLNCVDTTFALFHAGLASDDLPVPEGTKLHFGTYTSAILHGLKSVQAKNVAGESIAARLSRFGWPVDWTGVMAKCRVYAKSLYFITKDVLQLNFPDHSWRTKFGAFNQGAANRYPLELRLKYIEEIAVKEELDPIQARYQFQTILPYLPRIYEECGDNRLMMCRVLELYRRHDKPDSFRPEMGQILQIALSFIGSLDGTGDVERAFARLELLEAKRRIRKFHPTHMKDALQVLLEVPRTLDALVTKAPFPIPATAAPGSVVVEVMWRPKAFILKAQKKYLEFFGGRALKSRSQLIQGVAGKCAKLKAKQFRMNVVQQHCPRKVKATDRITKHAWRKQWGKAVSKLVVTAKRLRNHTEKDLEEEASLLLTPRLKTLRNRLKKRMVADFDEFVIDEAVSGLARPTKPFVVRKPKVSLAPQQNLEVIEQPCLASFSAKQKCFFAHGSERILPAVSTFSIEVKKMADAAVIVTNDDQFENVGVERLHAKLFGKSLASSLFLETRGQQGTVDKFVCLPSPLKVFLTKAAITKHPKLYAELLRASKEKQGIVVLLTAISQSLKSAHWIVGLKDEVPRLHQQMHVGNKIGTMSDFVRGVGAMRASAPPAAET
jgi:hypothetical protein